MKVWLHKGTGELVLATEHWDPIQIQYDESFYKQVLPEFEAMVEGRRIVRGLMLQVGWLIQNRHDIWFGVSLKTESDFEYLGELE